MGKWKKYYRIEFSLASGLNISGDSVNTDKDVLRNGTGRPFIPGSSLAGVYRACFTEDAKKSGFGYVKIRSDATSQSTSAEPDQIESRVKVYDATLVDNCVVSERDGVGLDEYKTARDSAKYDYEIVERGAKFVSFIEQDGENQDDFAYVDAIAKLWTDQKIFIGGKTRRGLGTVENVKIKYAKFNLECPKDRTDWLSFDMYGEKGYEDYKKKDDDQSNLLKKDDGSRLTINLELKLRGAISIRRYTTKGHTEEPDGASAPDYEMLCNQSGTPVIPGTSWAGLFRHSFKTQGVKDQQLEEIFGSIKKRSNISFSESIIEGGESKVVSRTAIDRFTGGAATGALYTERTHYGGTTYLTISYAGENITKYLATTIADLNAGFIALGGLTSVGRGLFSVENVKKNGVEITIDSKGIMERSKSIYDELTKDLKTRGEKKPNE